MEGPAGMGCEPRADFLMFVSGVVVEDGMNDFADGNLSLDGVQKSDELLMPVALHVLPDHGAVKDVQRREQRRRAVALVSVPPRPPD